MTEGLYLFVTSDRPDQYLNPILHCLQHKNLSKIVFLSVENRPGSDTSSSARQVRENVESLLSSLAYKGKYKYFTGSMRGKEIDLQITYSPDKLASIKEKYASAKARKVPWIEIEIDYFKLREELARIHKTEPDSVFDVSAVSKSYLGDLFAIGVVEGIDNIYTFNLNRSANFDEPWKSLFHELEFRNPGNKGYNYVNLTKTYIYDKCTKSILIRQPPLVLSLLIATVLLITLIVTSLVFGSTNWFVFIISSIAALASLLSFYYIFFPPKR